MSGNDEANYDQAAAFIGDNLPFLWFRIYSNCTLAGFDKQQALELVKAYIMSQGTNDKRV